MRSSAVVSIMMAAWVGMAAAQPVPPGPGSATPPPITPAATPPVPALSISDLASDKATSLSAAKIGTWKRSFIVFATTDGKVALSDVRVRVIGFQGTASLRAPAEVEPKVVPLDGASVSLDRQHPASVTISVDLDSIDTFTSTLLVTAPGMAPVIRPFTVQVGTPAAVAPIALQQVGPREFRSDGSEFMVKLTVVNTSDAPQPIAIVAGPRFTHKASGQPEVDAGLALTPDSTRPENKTIAAGAVDTIDIGVKNLDSAGEYNGEVRLTRAGTAPVVLNTKIFVKRGWAWAVLLIAAGVALAFGVGWFRDHFRARREARINLTRIRQRLEAILPHVDAGTARSVWQGLQQEGLGIDQDISLGKDVKATIELYSDRVVLFEDANQAARALEALLTASVQRDKRRVLGEVFAVITRGDDKAVVAARAKLDTINAANVVRDDLASALDALDASLLEHLETDDDTFKKAIETSVRPRLRGARESQRVDSLDTMRQEIELARTELARAGAASIQRSIAQAPKWADLEGWTRLVKDLTAMTPSEITPDAYLALRNALIDGMVDLTIKAALAEMIDVTALKAARDGTDRRKTLRALKDVQRELAQTKDPGFTDAKLMSATGAATVGDIPPIEESSPPEKARPPTWQRIQRRLFLVDAAVTGVVLVIAVLAGIKALWMGNSSWGSGNDMLNAFLWGTGFKVGADAFVGLTSLRSSLDKG